MKSVTITLLVLQLILTSCSLTEEKSPQLPIDLPDQWSTTSPGVTDTESENANKVSQTWWEDFKDPRLDRLVEEAFLKNPNLKETEARVRQAVAMAEIAGADLEPHLSAGLDAARSRQFNGSTGFGLTKTTSKTSSYGAGLNLSWEADLWGRIRAAEAAALHDLSAQEAVYDGALLSLAAQTAKAYFSALEVAEQVRLAEADLTDATDLAERIRERYQRGLRQVLDLKLAETEVDRAQSILAARERSLDALIRSLEALIGRYPNASLITDLESDLPALPDPVPAGVPAEILSRRPDLSAAESRILADASRTQAAERDLYPRISLTASTGLASDHLRDIARGDFGVWSLAGNVMMPIFEGGRLSATVNLREAEETESRAAFVTSALNAFREVETALAAEQKLVEQHRHLESYARDAEAAFQVSRDRYNNGLLDVLNVLEARRRLFSSRSACLSATRDTLANRIDLYVALGGGFEKTTSKEKEGDLPAKDAPLHIDEAAPQKSETALLIGTRNEKTPVE